MLRGIHRCLAPGGSLRLILIDPTPEANVLGSKLRKWLEKHLLLNLEQRFRCMNPTRLFPIWLEQAQLRAEGSTIVKPKFFAATSDARDDMKTQLYCHVGRMLWKEVWGRHVTTDKWWWEDSAIEQECRLFGTSWQFHLVTCVRDVDE